MSKATARLISGRGTAYGLSKMADTCSMRRMHSSAKPLPFPLAMPWLAPCRRRFSECAAKGSARIISGEAQRIGLDIFARGGRKVTLPGSRTPE